MTTGEVWVIANPIAGGGRALAHSAAAMTAMRGAGMGARLVVPSSPAETTAIATRAVHAGARAVVACGGDGTVHDVLQAMAATGTPMGFLPAGSGDDVASAFGFGPADPVANGARVVAALRLTPRSVDVAHATSADGTAAYFAGVLSTGFDSAVNERANGMSRLGGQRYNIAMLMELRSFRPQVFTVIVDGERHQDLGMLVAVGNGGQYGGGMQVCPAAVVDDGQLDLTWLLAVPIPRFLRLFPSVYDGSHVNTSYVRTLRGRNLQVDAADQVAYADGERLGPLPISVRMIPGGLTVLTAP